MHILVVGGIGFLGPDVVKRMFAAGHEVKVFHTGEHESDLPPEVWHVHSPSARTLVSAIPHALRELRPEVVLYMNPNGEQDARVVVAAFRGVARRVVAISSGDVYRAYARIIGTEPGPPDPIPLREDSQLREKLYPDRGETPRSQGDPERWIDDSDRILVERVVMDNEDLPGTILRLPQVYGPGDHQHRLFKYLGSMDDHNPTIVLDEGTATWRWQRGYVENVASAIALAAIDECAIGRIYNVGNPML